MFPNDWTEKKIEDLKVGDRIGTWMGSGRVVEITPREEDVVVVFRMADPGGNASICFLYGTPVPVGKEAL